MPKTKVDDWSTTAASNTDVGGISIEGTAPVSNMDDALREIMKQVAATPLAESAADMRTNMVVDRGRVFNILDYGAVSGSGDDKAAIQAAYDAASDGDVVVFPTGTWSCLTPLTLSGTKRVKFMKMPGAVMDATTATNAMPEAANFTGHMWQEVEQKSVYVEANGGFKLVSGTLRGTGADSTGQRDLMRVEMRAKSASTGPSWDGVGGSNINRDQVALSAFAIADPGSLYRAIWGFNTSAYFETGSDGQGTGAEVNIYLDSGIAAVKEIDIVKRKIAVYAVSQGSVAATAAFAFTGTGFYKGLAASQSALVNDAATRFLELTEKFEVTRDGATYIGKGDTYLYAAGVELLPTGSVRVTGDGTCAAVLYARDDTLASPADIRIEQDRALNAAAAEKVFTQKTVTASDVTAGSEDATITWQTIAAGTLATRMTLATALNLSVPLQRAGTQVVDTRKTGWTAATGTATRTSFATSTVTTAQLAERVKALIDDLISHGLIGA